MASEQQTTTASDAAVTLDSVGKTFHSERAPVQALAGLSFTLPHGSFTAIMGPSGAGKSTLMHIIGCLDTPTEGTITIDGRDVTTLSSPERTRVRATTIGFIFQIFQLLPRLTAHENVALPLIFQGVDRETRAKRADELLARVGLGDRTEHYPAELSGGQRRRVAIARALVNRPTLLLADEPTGNLDTETGNRILRLFKELNEEGNTILVVTHKQRVAECAERVIHLQDGVVTGTEQPSEVPPQTIGIPDDRSRRSSIGEETN